MVFGPTPEPDPRGVTLAPVSDDTPFPPVGTVPPRPSLTYSVQQERAIVDALISDREHARYTGQTIRYRAGRADSLPAAPPPDPVVRGETVLEPVPVVPSDASGAPLGPESLEPALAEMQTLKRDRGQVDEGGIDDFVRDLVDETAPYPEFDTETALIDQRNASGAPVPGRKGTESAFQRLFYYLVGEDDDPAAPEPDAAAEGGAGSSVPAATPPAPAADREAGAAPPRLGVTVAEAGEGGSAEPPPPPPEEAGADDPPPAESSAQLPRLKPDESADPPAPAPVKPDDGDRPEAEPGDAASGRDSS